MLLFFRFSYLQLVFKRRVLYIKKQSLKTHHQEALMSDQFDSESRIPAAVLGATGMVGRRFIRSLENHPWFKLQCIAASPKNRGRRFTEAVASSPSDPPWPQTVSDMRLMDVSADLDTITGQCGVIFSAVSMDKDSVRSLEEDYARRNTAVISCNSAHRWTEDVPMIIPEINPEHLDVIPFQQQNRGWKTGFIVVKPNCSIQGIVPVLHPLRIFGLKSVLICTCQAASGAGRILDEWDDLRDNVIPFIPGEEEKSEREPLKIWGRVQNGLIQPASQPVISATCIRIPVSHGHMAVVHAGFDHPPGRAALQEALQNFRNPLKGMDLPSAPNPLIRLFSKSDRPQTRLDRDAGKGMAVSVGRLREDSLLHWKFVTLSHNVARGAAGGAVLTAELCFRRGLIPLRG